MRIRKTAILDVKVHWRKSVETCRHVKHVSNPILTTMNQNPWKYLYQFFLNHQDLLHLHIHFTNSRQKTKKDLRSNGKLFDHNLDKNTDTKSDIIVIWGKCKRTYVYLTLFLFLFSSQGKVNVYWEELCIT